MKIFALLDVKANHFQKPFCDENTVNAIRGFTTLANDPNGPVNQYPDDFALCELAEFDRNSGKLVAYENPLNLTSARQLLKSNLN